MLPLIEVSVPSSSEAFKADDLLDIPPNGGMFKRPTSRQFVVQIRDPFLSGTLTFSSAAAGAAATATGNPVLSTGGARPYCTRRG